MMNDKTGNQHGGPGPPESTSSSLLARAKGQDPLAWEQITRLYSPLVYSWCRRSGVPPEDARDLVQEVFRSVYTGIGGFHGHQPGDTFRGWLWTIARNKVLDHFRARAGRPAAQGGTDAQQRLLNIPQQAPESDASSGSLSTDSPILKSLEPIRAGLEERTWAAFWRVTVGGEPTAQVAAELGMTVNAVRKAKCRVLSRLRDQLGGLIE